MRLAILALIVFLSHPPVSSGDTSKSNSLQTGVDEDRLLVALNLELQKVSLAHASQGQQLELILDQPSRLIVTNEFAQCRFQPASVSIRETDSTREYSARYSARCQNIAVLTKFALAIFSYLPPDFKLKTSVISEFETRTQSINKDSNVVVLKPLN
ncbi:MAG: hypothetical protein AAF434_09455 [Pseudomonadota bacterium]